MGILTEAVCLFCHSAGDYGEIVRMRKLFMRNAIGEIRGNHIYCRIVRYDAVNVATAFHDPNVWLRWPRLSRRETEFRWNFWIAKWAVGNNQGVGKSDNDSPEELVNLFEAAI